MTLIYAGIALNTALIAVRFALIVAGCYALYRWLQLKALPWVGAWYAVGFVADIIGAFILKPCVPLRSLVTSPVVVPPPPIAGLSIAMSFTEEVSALLAVVLIFSEAAFITRRLHPDFRPSALRLLVRIHEHVFALGISAVILAAADPLFALLYCYVRTH